MKKPRVTSEQRIGKCL